MNKDIIKEEAMDYVNNDLTLKETAKKFDISLRSIQLHFKKLKDIDPELHKLVLIKKSKNIELGRIKGGTIGKAKPRYSEEDALTIAMDIINTEMTYEEASIKYDIPKSTIYDMVHSSYIPQEVKDKLNAVSVANNKGILVSDLIRRNSR